MKSEVLNGDIRLRHLRKLGVLQHDDPRIGSDLILKFRSSILKRPKMVFGHFIIFGFGYWLRNYYDISNDFEFFVATWIYELGFFSLGLDFIKRILMKFSSTFIVNNLHITEKNGIFSTNTTTVSINEITSIEVRQNPLQKLLGLGEIDIVTQDHKEPEITISGVFSPGKVQGLIQLHMDRAQKR